LAHTSAIEAALASWRDAERRLARAVDGEAETIRVEIGSHRENYQRLSAEGMAGWMSKLKEAEKRRSHATPSTPPFHEAARDTQEIAAAIWEAARSSDEDTPQTEQNHRTTPGPTPPEVNTEQAKSKT
jgi:hypothetical protein